MTVTVLAILETDFVPQKNLAKIMNERLGRAARDLEQVHLKSLQGKAFSADDLIVYISYGPKYKVRFRVVNDVPTDIEFFVNELCGRLGYIHWKTSLIKSIDRFNNVFNPKFLVGFGIKFVSLFRHAQSGL